MFQSSITERLQTLNAVQNELQIESVEARLNQSSSTSGNDTSTFTTTTTTSNDSTTLNLVSDTEPYDMARFGLRRKSLSSTSLASISSCGTGNTVRHLPWLVRVTDWMVDWLVYFFTQLTVVTEHVSFCIKIYAMVKFTLQTEEEWHMIYPVCVDMKKVIYI